MNWHEQDISRVEAGSEPDTTAAWRERVLESYANDGREVQTLDATSFEQVSTVAREVDVIVNCAVTRFDTTMCCTWHCWQLALCLQHLSMLRYHADSSTMRGCCWCCMSVCRAGEYLWYLQCSTQRSYAGAQSVYQYRPNVRNSFTRGRRLA